MAGDLYTRAEVMERLRMSETTLRRIIAAVPTFAARRMTRMTETDIELILEAHQCRSTSRVAGRVSGTRAARSTPAVKGSQSRNTPQDAANELMLKMLHRNGTEKN